MATNTNPQEANIDIYNKFEKIAKQYSLLFNDFKNGEEMLAFYNQQLVENDKNIMRLRKRMYLYILILSLGILLC